MPDPQLPTLLLNDLGGTGMDAGRGMSSGGTEAMPRFAGSANPGETVFFSIDGEEFEVPIDQNGLWDFAAPELTNDTHEFEMWTRNEDGDESSRHGWETKVSANQTEREAQRLRNDDWHSRGQQAWRDDNERWRDGLTPTPVSAGSGGGAGSAGGAPGGGAAGGGAGGAGSSGTGQDTGEYPPTPVGGFEKGNSPGG